MTSAVELGGTPRDALICGTAVTTIVPSRISMKKHAATSRATLRSCLSIIERAAKHAAGTAWPSHDGSPTHDRPPQRATIAPVMKGSLPAELLEVLARSTTADYVTIDGRGQPVVWPLTPRYQATEGCIDVTVSRAQADVRVALLFSDTVAMILVQGTAHHEDRDTGEEIDVRVRPERVYVWRGSGLEAEPQLYDAHVHEVRSAHNEEPGVGHAPPEGGGSVWDERLDALGARHPDAVLAFVGPDGFPFAVRVPVRAERDAGLVLVDADPVGAPIEPGLACLCADAPGRRGFHVLGDLDEDQGVWVLRPHRVADPVHVG